MVRFRLGLTVVYEMVAGSRVDAGPRPAKGLGKAMVGVRIPFASDCVALWLPTNADELGPPNKSLMALKR